MRNTNTYFMMPKAMKERLYQIDFISDIAKNKAKHFIHKLMKDAFEDNKDLSQFTPVPVEYFRKAYNSRYRNDFLKPLIDNGIVQVNNSYSNFEDNPYCKSYRLVQDWLYKGDSYVSDNYVTETIGENDETIFVSPDTYVTKVNDNYNTSTISIPYMLHHLEKASLKADFESLHYDIDKLKKVAEDECNNIELKINEEIEAAQVKGYDRITNKEFKGSKTEILGRAHKRRYNLIQDGDKFYIDDLDRYVENKKKSLLLYNSITISKLKKGIFNIGRSMTNNRLNSNFTTMSKKLLAVIKEDNDLVEIDLCNSQFAILAHWLKKEGLSDKHRDVAIFCNNSANGTLYENLSTSLPYMLHRSVETKDSVKMKLIQMSFSRTGNVRSEFRTSCYRYMPNVIEFMDSYKKENGYENFSVELQKREAKIFIDDLLYNIKANGFFCITKHDSLIVKRKELVEILQMMKSYFEFTSFRCTVKVEKEIVSLLASPV